MVGLYFFMLENVTAKLFALRKVLRVTDFRAHKLFIICVLDQALNAFNALAYTEHINLDKVCYLDTDFSTKTDYYVSERIYLNLCAR